MWVSDSYEDIYTRAEASLARGDYEAAEQHFRRLAERLASLKPAVRRRRPELDNLHLISLSRQAEIRRIRGEFEGAKELYERLLEIRPQAGDRWRRNIALLKIDMGQAEAGLDELRAQAISHPQDHELWLTIGLECEGLGRADEAEENLRRGARLASKPEDKTEAYLLLFDFYRSQGRVEDAMAAWSQAWESHGNEPEYIFPVYQMMWENSDLERAYRYLDQEKNPLRKGLHEGLFAQSEGKPEEAVRHWKRVARMDPTDFEDGQEAWAEAALRADHPPEEVISVLGSLVESDQFTPRSLLLQAVAEARVGHIDHLENILQLARQIRLQARPRREKLAASDWALFDELVENAEVKEKVRHFFETDSPGEGEPDQG